MELARYVVEGVLTAGRSYREVAQAHGVSKSWVAKFVAPYRDGGDEASHLVQGAEEIPHCAPDAVEDLIVALRKELTDLGVDAGA